MMMLTDVHVFSDLVDQTHEVGVSPASLVQVVRLLQHLRQLLAPNVSETKFFSLSNSCKICNVQDMFHRGKKPFLLSQNIFPFERKMTRLKILNIWLRLRSDNFWLPTKLTAVVCTPIDLNFDSMNKKGLQRNACCYIFGKRGVFLSFHLNINFAWLFSPVSLGPPLDS